MLHFNHQHLFQIHGSSWNHQNMSLFLLIKNSANSVYNAKKKELKEQTRRHLPVQS